MAFVQEGDAIKVHYIGTLEDGTVFDSSEGREPLEFTVGSGQVIHGFDSAVMGMQVSEQKDILIPFQEAYGDAREDLIINHPSSEFPQEIDAHVGQVLELHNDVGGKIPAVITAVNDDFVTIDANHPLAGKNLKFKIELVEIA